MAGRTPVVICRLETMEAKKASHIWGKQIPSHFYGAEKACNTATQNHYALDINKLKQQPVKSHALSESIICAVQLGMRIMTVKKKKKIYIFYMQLEIVRAV